jgi:hypothetical protein
MNATIPTVGGELRVRTNHAACEVLAWSRYPDGHAMMAGGLRMDAQTLRLAIHALRQAHHDLEHEGVRRAA